MAMTTYVKLIPWMLYLFNITMNTCQPIYWCILCDKAVMHDHKFAPVYILGTARHVYISGAIVNGHVINFHSRCVHRDAKNADDIYTLARHFEEHEHLYNELMHRQNIQASTEVRPASRLLQFL